METRTRAFSNINTLIKLERKQTISPASPKRKKDIFLTTPQQTSYQKVLQLHQQLNNLILTMDTKIEDVINRHQSQFLIAYRNHSKKIRTQLQQIRNKAISVQSQANNLETVMNLQKQLVLFREQSLKLYDKFQQKTRECEQLNLRLAQANSQNRFLEAEVKKILKRAKWLEVSQIKHQNSQIFDNIEITNPTKDHLSSSTNQNASNPKRYILRKSKTIMNSLPNNLNTNHPLNKIKDLVPDKEVFKQIQQLIVQILNEKDKKLTMLQKKYEETIKKNATSNITSQLQNYFMQCVQTVRKDVFRRIHPRTSNIFQSQMMTFQAFKKLDQQRILQILVTHEEIIRGIYEIIFKKKSKAGQIKAIGKDLQKKYNSFVLE